MAEHGWARWTSKSDDWGNQGRDQNGNRDGSRQPGAFKGFSGDWKAGRAGGSLLLRLACLVASVSTVLIWLAGFSAPAASAASLPLQNCVYGITPTTPARQHADVKNYFGDPSSIVLKNLNIFVGAVVQVSIASNVYTYSLLPDSSRTLPLPAAGNVISQLPQYNGFSIDVLTSGSAVSYTVKSTMCPNDEIIWHYGGTVAEPTTTAITAQVMVQMGRKVAHQVSMTYGTIDGTAKAGTDYTPVSGLLTFQPGEQTKYISVPIPVNTNFAGPKSFSVGLNALPGPTNPNTTNVVNPVVTVPVTITGNAAPQPVPAAPVLKVTGETTSSISLSWTAVSGAAGYRVYEGSTQVAATTSATSATIGSLASNTSHTYTVSAYNSSGESARSNAVSATTLATWLYSFVSQTSSLDLAHARPGQVSTITVKVRNTGTATWTNSGANPVRLGTDNPRDHVGVFQSPGWLSATRAAVLQEPSVPPGGTGTFIFNVTAPSAAGTVTEAFTPVADGLTWLSGPGISVTITTVPIVGMAIAPAAGIGQWVAAADGGVFTYAGAPFYGSMGGQHLNAPIVGIAATRTGHGYWLAGADGGVFAYGDAAFTGSMAGQPLNASIVGIVGTPSGNGYWLVGADGGVFTFGDAGFYGSMGGRALNQPITGIAATPDGRGYWLVGADGGVFAFGDAVFSGSMANHPLNAPITGISSTLDGRGYWLVGADGGVFAFGTAGFAGSLGSGGSSSPVIGIAATPNGYALIDRTGLVTAYTTSGEAPRTTLYQGERLNPGEQLTSDNGRYVLVMQGDGNLVEYEAGHPVWASGTNVPGSDFEAQADGNFVIYAPGHVAVWATGTNHSGSVLTIQDDRNIVIYAPGHVAVWASNTGV